MPATVSCCWAAFGAASSSCRPAPAPRPAPAARPAGPTRRPARSPSAATRRPSAPAGSCSARVPRTRACAAAAEPPPGATAPVSDAAQTARSASHSACPPVALQAPQAQPQHPRGQPRHRPRRRQQQKTRIIGDQKEPRAPLPRRPPDPALLPALRSDRRGTTLVLTGPRARGQTQMSVSSPIYWAIPTDS